MVKKRFFTVPSMVILNWAPKTRPMTRQPVTAPRPMAFQRSFPTRKPKATVMKTSSSGWGLKMFRLRKSIMRMPVVRGNGVLACGQAPRTPTRIGPVSGSRKLDRA